MKANTYKSTGLILILMSLTLSVTQCSEGEGLNQLTALENEISEIGCVTVCVPCKGMPISIYSTPTKSPVSDNFIE